MYGTRDKGRNRESQRMTQQHRMSRVFWAKKWGISEKQLEEAIEQTDETDPAAVRRYLINHKYLTS